MRVAVPRETAAGERRVALVPETVTRLVAAGFDVRVARGAGEAAGFRDAEYGNAGAELVDPSELLSGADAVVRVARPTPEETAALPSGTVLIGFLQP